MKKTIYRPHGPFNHRLGPSGPAKTPTRDRPFQLQSSHDEERLLERRLANYELSKGPIFKTPRSGRLEIFLTRELSLDVFGSNTFNKSSPASTRITSANNSRAAFRLPHFRSSAIYTATAKACATPSPRSRLDQAHAAGSPVRVIPTSARRRLYILQPAMTAIWVAFSDPHVYPKPATRRRQSSPFFRDAMEGRNFRAGIAFGYQLLAGLQVPIENL